jgi:hypothetical protein
MTSLVKRTPTPNITGFLLWVLNSSQLKDAKLEMITHPDGYKS